MLRILSELHARHADASTTPRYLRAMRRMGRVWLRVAILPRERSRPNDVTVVIGARNRSDYRLVNALRSLREQEYPADLVRIIVVDYGSAPAFARDTARIAEEYRADYLAVERAPVWSRSRCLNVGIRMAESKFLLTSDVDIVLSPRYLAEAIATLVASPLCVVCSPMFDLPETSAEMLEGAAHAGSELAVEEWKRLSQPRNDWKFHPSICMTYAKLYQLLRGYDEYYELWGSEDDDLMRRFVYLGLEPRALDSSSFYLHQWHPKFEGVPDGRNAEQVQRNLAYIRKTHSILRNDRDWGIPRP